MNLALASLAISIGACSHASAPSASVGVYQTIQTWTGDELDHLGIGLSPLGDVNGDGYPDFILGKMTGAYAFFFGPGAAQVISGKDGNLLYEVYGTQGGGRHCGDAYGDSMAEVGDLDGDGVPDFAVGAWRYGGHLGLAVVYSGKDGKPLATIYGDGRVTRGEGPIPAQECDDYHLEGFGGWITPLGDIDGDRVPDFAIGGEYPDSGSVLVSGARFTLRSGFPGDVVGMTGDFDGDGHPDVLCVADSGNQLIVCSVADHRQLIAFPLGRTRFGENVQGPALAAVGDVDGDGFLDVYTVELETGVLPAGLPPVRGLNARCTSGWTGEILFAVGLEPAVQPQQTSIHPIGDVDGDGITDVLVQASFPSGGGREWIVSGGRGKVLGSTSVESGIEGRRVVRIGNVDGDRSVRLLVSDYESQAGARCGGAVHLVRLTLPPE
jgi:FG-GAP-like repeat